MYSLPKNWYARLERGQYPVPFIGIAVGQGSRYYGPRDLYAVIYGSGGLKTGLSTPLCWAARVKSFGRLRRTISPIRADLLGGFTVKQLQTFTVTLADPDSGISALVQSEAWCGKPLALYFAFEDDDDVWRYFTGHIAEVLVRPAETIIKAEE